MSVDVHNYQFKTQPFHHQLTEWLESREAHARAIFWEQGTGKSKLAIDTTAWLYSQGLIDALLIVAPNGVHRNWITEEIPTHMPDRVVDRMRALCYRTEKVATRWHQEECASILKHQGLAVLSMSFDAVTTGPLEQRDKSSGARKMIWKGGRKYLWDFLSKRKVLYIVDEARRIKNPKADRTKVVVKSAVYAPYRRVLNGTPVPNGPFDIFSQLHFLDENFWKQHGVGTWSAFKTYFGEFKQAQVRDNGGNMRTFQQLVSYRNLDHLNRIIDTVGTRVTKEDVLDLPDKIYTRRGFELTDTQQKIYKQLRDEFMVVLESGEVSSAALAITRMLRLQQVTSGFLPTDEGNPGEDIGKVNPRLELLFEILEDHPHKAIIWCRFRRTLNKIMTHLGEKAVRYDGAVDEDGRRAAVERFQRGDAQFFVSNPKAAGEGLTLHAARTVIYVENSFDLAERLQSEDRAHRIGQKHPVEYIDLVAERTIDAYIVKALVEKLDISRQITGDRVKEWLN